MSRQSGRGDIAFAIVRGSQFVDPATNKSYAAPSRTTRRTPSPAIIDLKIGRRTPSPSVVVPSAYRCQSNPNLVINPKSGKRTPSPMVNHLKSERTNPPSPVQKSHSNVHPVISKSPDTNKKSSRPSTPVMGGSISSNRRSSKSYGEAETFLDSCSERWFQMNDLLERQESASRGHSHSHREKEKETRSDCRRNDYEYYRADPALVMGSSAFTQPSPVANSTTGAAGGSANDDKGSAMRGHAKGKEDPHQPTHLFTENCSPKQTDSRSLYNELYSPLVYSNSSSSSHQFSSSLAPSPAAASPNPSSNSTTGNHNNHGLTRQSFPHTLADSERVRAKELELAGEGRPSGGLRQSIPVDKHTYQQQQQQQYRYYDATNTNTTSNPNPPNDSYSASRTSSFDHCEESAQSTARKGSSGNGTTGGGYSKSLKSPQSNKAGNSSSDALEECLGKHNNTIASSSHHYSYQPFPLPSTSPPTPTSFALPPPPPSTTPAAANHRSQGFPPSSSFPNTSTNSNANSSNNNYNNNTSGNHSSSLRRSHEGREGAAAAAAGWRGEAEADGGVDYGYSEGPGSGAGGVFSESSAILTVSDITEAEAESLTESHSLHGVHHPATTSYSGAPLATATGGGGRSSLSSLPAATVVQRGIDGLLKIHASNLTVEELKLTIQNLTSELDFRNDSYSTSPPTNVDHGAPATTTGGSRRHAHSQSQSQSQHVSSKHRAPAPAPHPSSPPTPTPVPPPSSQSQKKVPLYQQSTISSSFHAASRTLVPQFQLVERGTRTSLTGGGKGLSLLSGTPKLRKSNSGPSIGMRKGGRLSSSPGSPLRGSGTAAAAPGSSVSKSNGSNRHHHRHSSSTFIDDNYDDLEEYTSSGPQVAAAAGGSGGGRRGGGGNNNQHNHYYHSNTDGSGKRLPGPLPRDSGSDCDSPRAGAALDSLSFFSSSNSSLSGAGQHQYGYGYGYVDYDYDPPAPPSNRGGAAGQSRGEGGGDGYQGHSHPSSRSGSGSHRLHHSHKTAAVSSSSVSGKKLRGSRPPSSSSHSGKAARKSSSGHHHHTSSSSLHLSGTPRSSSGQRHGGSGAGHIDLSRSPPEFHGRKPKYPSNGWIREAGAAGGEGRRSSQSSYFTEELGRMRLESGGGGSGKDGREASRLRRGTRSAFEDHRSVSTTSLYDD